MSLSGPSSTPSRWDGALPAVLFVTLVFFINYTDRAVLGPLLGHMEKSLHLSHVQATSLLLFLSTGFSCGMLSSGFLTALVPPRLIVVFSVTGSGIMLLGIARAEALWEVRLLFTLLGLVSGTYLPAAMATLGSLVRQEIWGRTVAVHELSPTVSFITSPLLAEAIAARYGWQGAMEFMGYLSLCAGLLFFLFGKGGRARTDRPSAGGVKAAIRHPVFRVFIWFFALGIGGEFAPYSVLPLSLTAEQGLNSTDAAHLLSLSRLAAPFVVLLGGIAVTKLGTRTTIAIFLVGHGFALAAMALPASLIGTFGLFLAMSAQSMTTAFLFPALFTLLSRTFPPGQQPLLLSLSVPIAAYLGGGIIPLALGICGQYLSFAAGYLFFGLICLASLPLLRICTPEKEGDAGTL